MDWTIVVSVLVALLLVPAIMVVLGGLAFLTGATVLRGRLQGFMQQRMAHCKEMCKQMFGPRETTNAATSEPGSEACPCRQPSEGS